MAYACRVLADSISPAGHRITSFEVTFPRIVLAELNTHCMLSRNSASSRARPIAFVIAAVVADPFVPEAFGRNQKGMQPGEALEGELDAAVRETWVNARNHAIVAAEELAAKGVHKQYANRLLEPFSWHTAVVTGTDLDNFFHLRINPAAQGELRKAVELMHANRANSEPIPLDYGRWHAPYVLPNEAFDLDVRGVDIAAVSAARCARVSYLTQNGERDVSEDLALYGRLVEAGHMSPLEHVARPMTANELRVTMAYDVSFDGGPALRVSLPAKLVGEKIRCSAPRVGDEIEVEETGLVITVTSVRGPLHYSGKLNGWISRRAHVPGEHDILGHRAG
jgi:thymidylate synthase ThyX